MGQLTVFLLLILSLGFAHGARGNGDEFFQGDVLESDNKPLETQILYAGRVKDQDGDYIEDATITVAITVPTPRGERRVTYNAYTNNIGRYLTLDVAGVVLMMEAIEVEVEPDEVEVTVEKEGYEVVRRLDRSRTRQKNGLFEIDFWMTRQAEE